MISINRPICFRRMALHQSHCENYNMALIQVNEIYRL
jgi:hypothetical protein